MNRLAKNRRLRLAEHWLGWLLRGYRWRDDLLGDFAEQPQRRLERALEVTRLSLRYLPSALWLAIRRPHTPHRTRETRMQWATELRLSWRGLRKRPATSLLIVVTLAIGLAANAAVFGLLDALVLQPFSFPEPDRLLMIGAQEGDRVQSPDGSMTAADFADVRAAAAQSVHAWIGYDTRGGNLIGSESPERVQISLVSPEFFAALDTRAALGRLFDDAALTAEARPLVLGHALWQRVFGGDRGVLGRGVTLDQEPFTIVGVAPSGFSFPPGTETWAPLRLTPDEVANRVDPRLGVFGRLRRGATDEQAAAQLRAIEESLSSAHPETNHHRRFTTQTIAEGFADPGVLPLVLLWQTAAVLVLLIGWVNVAQMVVARGQDRQHQFALLGALGAGRRRLTALLGMEGLLYGLAATLAALPLAALAERLLRNALPQGMRRFVPGWERIGFDFWTLGFVSLLAVVSIVAVSLWPALRAGRTHVGDALRGAGRGASAGPGRQRARGALVILEVAFGLALVASSSIAVRGARNVLDRSPGYDSRNVLTFRVNLSEPRYSEPGPRRDFVRSTLERLRSVPGVESVAVTQVMPGQGNNSSRDILLWGEPEPEAGSAPQADYRSVTEDFFSTLRLPILAGRGLEASDDADAPPVAVISRSMAERFWQGRDPLGQKFRAGDPDAPWLTVVGVAADHLHHWFDRRDYPTYFVPYAQQPRLWPHYALKTQGEPESFEPAVRQILAAIDPTQAPYDVMSLDRLRREGAIGIRFAASVMAVLAGLALALAVSGIYGVMSYNVSTRTRDLGVRVALGATQFDVLRSTLGRVLALAAVGLVLGLGLSIVAGRALRSVLRDVAHLDASLAFGAVGVLTLAAALASLLPARRALLLDPVDVLRAD